MPLCINTYIRTHTFFPVHKHLCMPTGPCVLLGSTLMDHLLPTLEFYETGQNAENHGWKTLSEVHYTSACTHMHACMLPQAHAEAHTLLQAPKGAHTPPPPLQRCALLCTGPLHEHAWVGMHTPTHTQTRISEQMCGHAPAQAPQVPITRRLRHPVV